MKSSLALSVLVLASFVGGASAAEPRFVSVSGVCIRGVIPDRSVVTITSEAKDADAKRAQVAATRGYEAVRSRVAKLSLPDAELSTSEYFSDEIREWEKDKMVSKGFRTRISLRVETSDHARIGEVIDIASREGIKQISGLQLLVSSKKMLEEKMGCLKDAAEQARAKAESLAKALNAKVGEVMTINESSNVSEVPMPMMRGVVSGMVMAKHQDAAPTIETGKTELTTNVQVTFGLK